MAAKRGTHIKKKYQNPNQPGSLIAVAGGSEAELAGEDGLTDVALNLEHLRTALRLAVELKDESRVGLGPHVQVKLRGG